MSIKEGLANLDKIAVSFENILISEEKNGPMKTHLYEEMVGDAERGAGGAGLLLGGALGYQGSAALQERRLHNAKKGLDATEAENLLKGTLAEQALFDPSRIDDLGRLTQESELAEQAYRAAQAKLNSLKHSTLGNLAHNGRAGLVGGVTAALGLAGLNGRSTHNYLNKEEGLGLEEQSLAAPAVGLLGGAAGGLAGMRFMPKHLGGRLAGGLLGSGLGSGVGTIAVDASRQRTNN